jgi:hypothetical protein
VLTVLQFLIQADFLLIASREDIDDSSQWNRALREGVINAFVRTARLFNQGPLQYTWPRYLPGKSPISGFFAPCKDALERKLSQERLLESCNGNLAAGVSLTWAPDRFTDENGVPLTLNPDTAPKYLSPKYATTDRDNLTSLNVKEMTNEDFIGDMAKLLFTRSALFHSQSSEWHSTLARALIPLAIKKEFRSWLTSLPLIPLRDGRWVSMKGASNREQHIFFEGDRQGLTIPDGFDALVVDPKASASHSRANLYQLLGVANFDVPGLCKAIVEEHNDAAFKPSDVSIEALISQTLFLFNAGWRNEEGSNIWCVCERGDRVSSAGLYLDSQDPYSATQFFSTHRDQFPFLHSSYMTAYPQNSKKWHIWLLEVLKVASHPRMAKRTIKSRFIIHQDFEWVLLKKPSTQWLLLLREYWPVYQEFLEKDEGKKEREEPNLSRSRVRDILSRQIVSCRDGTSSRLDATFLPTDEMLAAAKGCVPFLDIPNPEDGRWRVALKPLGVSLTTDLLFYLRALENLKRKNPSHDLVCEFLEQIQARSGENVGLVK